MPFRNHDWLGVSNRRVRRLLRSWRLRREVARALAEAPPRGEIIPPSWRGLPNWTAVLDTNRPLWARARQEAAHGPRVLAASVVGGFTAGSIVDSMLAIALTLRGANVVGLLCDEALPACLRAERAELPDPQVIERYQLPDALCPGCVACGHFVYDPLDLEIHKIQRLLTAEETEEARRLASSIPYAEIKNYRRDNQAVGEHAYAGALRYFASGNLEHEALGETVTRRYFEGGLRTAFAMRRLLGKHRFDAAYFAHGIYSPHGIVGDACRAHDVKVVNWVVAYRKRCFVFSHGDTYHHTLMNEPTSTWEDLPWTGEMEADILAYLESRRQGSRDWIYFHEKPDEDFGKFATAMGLDVTKPTIGLLTNVIWDAQLHYPANAFPDMLTWVLETIEFFRGRPELQLLIRVHPAEIRGTLRTRQPLVAEIARRMSELPDNVFIIPPESPVSTYAAVGVCNAVIIYGTKTGVELTSMGIPTIVAGEAWIRNKGLTHDASSAADYFRILSSLPFDSREDAVRLQRARKYAYHFFFRRMMPIAFIEPIQGPALLSVNISRLDDLLPGRDPGLDIICDGILHGQPFVYRSETLGVRCD